MRGKQYLLLRCKQLVTKNQLCIKCGTHTQQQLVRSPAGCDWKCNVCKNQMVAYTYADMSAFVQKHVFNAPENVKTYPTIPEGYTVYLKCEFSPDFTTEKEMEVNANAVQDHVKATGKLPQAGKPLFAQVDGILVPYGEVARIATKEDSQ